MYSLYLDVLCSQAAWATVQGSNLKSPVYRLYIDEELLIERTWVYGQDDLITEELHLNIELNQFCKIYVELLMQDPDQARFLIRNLRCSTHTVNVRAQTEHSFTFTVN